MHKTTNKATAPAEQASSKAMSKGWRTLDHLPGARVNKTRKLLVPPSASVCFSFCLQRSVHFSLTSQLAPPQMEQTTGTASGGIDVFIGPTRFGKHQTRYFG
jgi:hypothetical protein